MAASLQVGAPLLARRANSFRVKVDALTALGLMVDALTALGLMVDALTALG